MNLFLYFSQETNVFQMSWKVENKRNTKRQKANENIEGNINHRQKLRQTVLSKTNKTASQRSKVKGTSTLEKEGFKTHTHIHTVYPVEFMYSFQTPNVVHISTDSLVSHK